MAKFKDKNLVLIEAKLYSLTDKQQKKFSELRMNVDTDDNLHYASLNYVQQHGKLLHEFVQPYNY